MLQPILALVIGLLVALSPAHAQPCRLALALGLDVSASVDAQEYRLQLDGLAKALESPEVTDLLLATPGHPIWISVFEWSSGQYQQVIQSWAPITNRAALSAVTLRLRSWHRKNTPITTGIGAALRFGAALLAQKPHCEKFTLDISGDGTNNNWPEPEMVRRNGELDGITVNGLVIGQELPSGVNSGVVGVAELTAYYRALVIHGPGAFIELALSFEDYSDAMTRKLIREIGTLAIGRLGP